MLKLSETFFTSIGCMDGRAQEPVAKYGKDRWGVLYADTITDAGLVKHLAHSPTPEFLDNIKRKVIDISIKKHNSKGIVVHGHQECSGNPVSDEQQKEDIVEATRVIRELEPKVEVISIFVKRSEEDPAIWITEEIY